LYRAGPPDKLVTLVRPATRDDIDIPETALAGLGYLNGESLGSLLDAEFEATEASLFAADVPAIRIEIDALDPHSLGRLLYEMEAACILFGELANISTFTQPAVEWGKRATRGLLRDASTAETETITDKQTFIIE
jgi:glucose-6-phosphate isomerase